MKLKDKDIYERVSSLLPEEELETSIPETSEAVSMPKKTETSTTEEPSILDLYKQQMQKMEEETSRARTMDEVSSLVNTLSPFLSGRSRARAIVSAGSLGADPGVNQINLKTNRAEEARSASKDRMKALLDQYDLTSKLQGKQMTPEERRKLEVDIELKKAQTAKLTKEGQQLEKELSKKPGDDLTQEQRESAQLDLDLKRTNLEQARKKLIDDPDKSLMEKRQGLANIERTLAGIRKTEAEIAQMNKPSELSLLDQTKIEESKARTEKYKADSQRYEEDRKQKQELADLQKQAKQRELTEKNRQDREELENANEKIKKVERLEKLLSKKGGVTGFFDNTVKSLIDSQSVSDEATARNIARKELMDLAVDQTLLKTAQTKGAITNEEMALFQKGIPTLYSQEPEWISWLGKVKDTQKRLIAKIQETSPMSTQPEQVKVPGAAQGAQKDSTIEQYAKQNNINYEKAERILKYRGYNAK